MPLVRAALVVLALLTLESRPSTAAVSGAPEDTTMHARLDTLRLRDPDTGDSLVVAVWLPPQYRADRPLPAVYAFPTGVYFDRLRLPATLDSAMRAGLPPAVVVALPDPELEAYLLGSAASRTFLRQVAEVVVPAVEARYAVRRERAGRRFLGFSAGANLLLELAMREPALVARVAAQSPGWMLRDSTNAIGERMTPAALAAARTLPRGGAPRFWFVWGDGAEPWESASRENGRAVMAALRERGAPVTYAGTVPGGHGLPLGVRSMEAALRFLLAE
ncbi:MAG TPA: alpha/beta hydrolase-fold protein [Gemmatimonadales bacterium]|nr:alpha/beta hydrolase-fold protein [Gemmatimonadales bacterium]